MKLKDSLTDLDENEEIENSEDGNEEIEEKD